MILGLIAFVVLAGCSSDKEDSKGSDKTGDNKEKVELSLWLTPQWEGVLDPSEEGADYDSFFKHAAERFEEEYEDYDVEINVEVVASDQRDELLNVNLNGDRKSTRLNSSHVAISYAVFCLNKKTSEDHRDQQSPMVP